MSETSSHSLINLSVLACCVALRSPCTPKKALGSATSHQPLGALPTDPIGSTTLVRSIDPVGAADNAGPSTATEVPLLIPESRLGAPTVCQGAVLLPLNIPPVSFLATGSALGTYLS